MIASADEFVRLRTSADPDEYRRAAHEEAPEGVWLAVIETYPEMRSWVAHNKTVPIAILTRLADDPDEDVRGAVADKRKLTVDLFDILSRDPSPSVRTRIACNPKAPSAVVERLAQDAEAFVAVAALGRLLDTPGNGS